MKVHVFFDDCGDTLNLLKLIHLSATYQYHINLFLILLLTNFTILRLHNQFYEARETAVLNCVLADNFNCYTCMRSGTFLDGEKKT